MARLLLLLTVTAAVCHYAGVGARRHDGHHNKHRRRELFMGSRASSFVGLTADQQNNTEVVAQLGGTATIRCYTNFLGDEMVSWLKRDEDHLLTAGAHVYSSELRYSVSHVRHQKLWQLTLRDVRATDAGLYECQLTTHPPTSLFFTLRVVKARAVIQGGPDIHVDTGVTLRLMCTVEHATEPPMYIFWFHNGSMVNYAPRRTTLNVMTHNFGSTLLVTNVTWGDAGYYTCEPYLAVPANITLHVVPGEKHAALHNGQNDNGVNEDEASSGISGSAHLFPTWLLIGSLSLAASIHEMVFQTIRDRL